MKKTRIPRGQFPKFTGDIDVEFDDAQFDLVPEDFPDGIEDKRYKGNKVRWVSNFKLKKKPNAERKGLKVKYYIELAKSTGELVYFDGTDVFFLPYTDLGNGNVRAELDADDPAAGWTP